MERTGRVLETFQNRAIVEVDNRCDAGCKFCPVGHLFSGDAAGAVRIEADNQAGARIGDTVQLELCARTSLAAYGLAYGVPMIGFIVGALLGAGAAARFPKYETHLIAFFSFLGLVCGGAVTLYKGKRFRALPVITAVK